MSIESIRGVVSSIITIAAYIGFKCDLVQHFKKRPINEFIIRDNQKTHLKFSNMKYSL